MSLFREIPPTAGLPLYARDIFCAFSKRNPSASLEEDFKKYLGASYAAITYSGTAAFYIILEALKKLSPRKTVIIPAFICPLIPLAIKRAGLKVAVCDINKVDFNFEVNQLKKLCANNNDILAIVAVHLAGIAADFQVIQDIVKENKIFIVEDCAQSLGAVYQNKKTGTLGDFAFFSLCRGKGLTTYEGGVIVSSLKFAALIDSELNRLAKTDLFSECLKVLELFGYWIFYRPFLFWFVFRLPQLFWQLQGKMEKAFIEYFSVDFPLHKVSKMRKSVAHAMFDRLENEITNQRKTTADYIEGLKGLQGIKLITEPNGSTANYPYLTLLFDETAQRDKVFNILHNSGLGVALIYLAAITDYAYLKDMVGDAVYPNARAIAKNHITLTTSRFLTQKDICSLIERIKKI
ncbi:MAG: aminotransferase class I/II-fold pyridoxal phosphate-dependent enzyme [Candidatus Omnitrophica bacterium]|nr:aminotransferase class I/II-fold pyridoxal phosphate-dependent enzyme [Candidatus Omnitrophota bacterium]